MSPHHCDHCGIPRPDADMVQRIICTRCDAFTPARLLTLKSQYAHLRIGQVQTLEDAKALSLESEHVNRLLDFLLTSLAVVEDCDADCCRPGVPYLADLLLDDTIDRDEELAQ